MGKHKKSSENPVDELFEKLNEIDWTKKPFRGLIAEVGIESGYPKEYARISARKNIFVFKNLDLATKLKRKVDAVNNHAASVL